MMLAMNGVCVLILWVGAGSIDAGNMQVGDMMAFIQYTMQIIAAFLMISLISVMLPRASLLHGCHLDSILLAGYDQDAFACTEPDPVANNDIGSVLNCLFH